ncbi:MAG: hypothetical protein IPJ58_11510 [Ardenticatenia bacterium]|nr:hypothetical protein [Ardenticatenia bacterium]
MERAIVERRDRIQDLIDVEKLRGVGKISAVITPHPSPATSQLPHGRAGKLLATITLGFWTLALAPPLYGKPGFPLPLQTGPSTSETLRKVFLPLVLRPAERSTAAPWPQVATQGHDVDALAIAGNLLYVGVGPTVVTYDVSESGAAKRLSQSLPLGGRVARLAASGDRLFAATRPDFDAEEWRAGIRSRRSPGPIVSPPITSLAIFDLAQTDAPRLLRNIALTNELRNFFAIDLAAHERVAYVTVASRARLDESSEELSCFYQRPECGLLIVDATGPSTHLNLRQDMTLLGYRLLTDEGRLYLVGSPPLDEELRQEYGYRTRNYDLTDPSQPRLISAPGHVSLAQQVGVFSLAVADGHVFRVLTGGELLTSEIAADGDMRLMLPVGFGQDGAWLPRVLDTSAVTGASFDPRTVAEGDRLHLLLSGDPIGILSVSVATPLHPTRYGQIDLLGIHYPAKVNLGSNSKVMSDASGDLVATQDARLFVAGGDSGLLVEVDVSRAGNLRELARYEVAAAP